MKLSVVIVSYNVRFYLEQCIASIHRAARGIDTEIWVVDNHSQDDSVALIRQSFPDVHVIAKSQNLGFARANNIAIRKATGQYVLLLNPDTVVGEHTLRDAVAFMDAHPDAGATGVRMLKSDGGDAMESRRGIPTPLTAFYKMSGLCTRFPRNHRLGKYYMSYLPWDQPERIEIVSGAFCLLRRKALDEIGLLDEDFFMYGEDIDLSYRLLKGGWHNWYLPTKILHYKGESTNKGTPHYVNTFYKAMAIFFRKHYPHSRGLVIPVYVAIYLLAAKALLFQCLYKMRRSLHLFHEPATAYHFIMSQASLQHAKRLADKYHLAATYTTVPDKPTEPSLDAIPARDGKRHVAVYDTRSYTFSEILATFDAANRTDCTIGTFYPDQGLLITDKRTFLI